MKGTNPIRKPTKGTGDVLEVQEIFPTLQGEGPLAGTPAVFIRLGGCNLACNFCDTQFEDFSPWSMAQIMSDVRKYARNDQGVTVRKLAVITGGEPFRQPIAKLCSTLLEEGFAVQVETNGTLFRPINTNVQIVCSPKNTGKGYKPVRADILERCMALKFIVSKSNEDYSYVGDVGQSQYNVPVYVQPMDEYNEDKNADNLRYARELCERHGYRLCLQLHKLLGIA